MYQKKLCPFLTTPTQKFIEVTSSFPEFVSACQKITLSHLLILEIQQNLLSWPNWSYPFLKMLTKKKFNQLLSKYWALSSRTSYGSLTPSHMFGKNYDPIPSKCQDKRMDGRTDGRTNPPATSEGRKSIYLHSYLPFITRKFWKYIPDVIAVEAF